MVVPWRGAVVDGEGAVLEVGAFVHAFEAEAGVRHVVGVEAVAVVFDKDDEVVVVVLGEGDADGVGVGVFLGVGDGFLDDAVGGGLDRLWEAGVVGEDGDDVDLEVVVGGGLGESAERGD